MKKWVALIFLVATAFSQQTNQDFWPASPGLNLGKSNQRWNGNFNNVNITGTCTINGASCLGAGSVTGATNNGGLVLTGHTLGMLKTCSTGQILSWNGTAWVCTSAGSGLPAGSDTQIQVNSVGGFGASPNFTFNLGTSVLSLSGTANISGALTVTGALTNSALGPGGPFCVQETNGVFSSTGIACGSGGGGGVGPGTVNRLLKFGTSTTAVNSSLADNGTTITSTEQMQIQNSSQFNLTLSFPCNQPGGMLSTSPCAGATGSVNNAVASAGSTGTFVGVFGEAELGSSLSSTPFIAGTYGYTSILSGSPTWIAGAVGVANTNGSGTVGTDSGVVGIGAIGTFGAGGQNATILDGVDAQIQTQAASSTAVKGAGVYVRSPSLTGAVTHLYGLYIEDQTIGGGLNTDPWGIFEAGNAKNQLGGSLTLAGIVGSTQCLHVNSVGLISGTGADCGSGSSSFPSGTGFAFVNASSSWASAVASTGTGNVVLSSNAVLVTPNLGTPSAIVLTNATGFPTLNQNTTGTSGGLTGCTQAAAGDVCYWNGSAWVVFTGNNSGTAVFQENASGVPSWGAGVAATYQVNGVALSSASTINFQNSAATTGLTLTFTNTSAGIVKLGFTGTLTNAGLANSATTVNGQTCTLGSTCTVPEQVNTVNMTSQAGFNLLTSTTNSVGLTVTPVNSATNALKFEITGGSYTGNAAGLFGTPSITVNGLTATTLNGTTMSGTFAGNPTFSGSPVFGTMTGGPFCVQETGGVLSSTGSTCGSGSGSVSGTANAVSYFATTSTLGSVSSAVSGAVLVGQGTGSAPIFSVPSLKDNGSGPITTTPYTIQCDSGTSILDRSTTIPFGSGASVVVIPLSSGSGCPGLSAILEPQGVSLTINASAPDTFDVYGAGPALVASAASVTITDGQYATINQSNTGKWTIRITQGGSVTSIVIGAGLASTQSPLTTTGTMSIATSGITSAMIGSNQVSLGKIQTIPANSSPMNVTGVSASMLAFSWPSCNSSNNAIQYTTNTGPTCNTNTAQLNTAQTQTALYTFGTNISIGGVTAAGATGTGNVVFATSPTITSSTLSGASTVVPSGATLTIQSGGSLVCAGGATCPTGVGTVTHTGTLTGSAFVTGNGGADITTPATTSTLSAGGDANFAGTLTAAKAITFPWAGTASTPAVIISGAPYTAGTALQDMPQLYLNCTGATAASFSANGSYIGVNACTPFTGNFIDFHVSGGNSEFSITGTGIAAFQPAAALGGSTANVGMLGVASDTNTGAVLLVNTGTSSQQRTVDFQSQGVSQLQVCWQAGPQGEVVFGSAVACGSIYTTTFAKNVFQSQTAAHTLIRGWQASNAATSDMIQLNNATAAGSGYNFLTAYAGVTGTDTFHTGGTLVASIRGDGLFTGTFAAGSTAHGVLISEGLTTAAVATATGSSGQCLISGGASADPAWGACASGGSGTVTSVGLVGTTNQITVTGASPITTSGTWTISIPASLGLGTDGTTAGTLVLSNSAVAFHSTISSGATANNTVKLFATVPTNGDMFYCVVASTTCTLTDANFLASNVVLASAPGAGIGHFAGSTQTLTSSLIVAADITSATITGTQIASGIALAGSPTTTSQAICDNSTKIATTAYGNISCTVIETSGSPLTMTGNSGYYYNDTASAYTFQLDAPVIGKTYCFANRKARSSAVTIKATTSVTIYYKGVAGTVTTGTLVSGGAAGDAICVVGTDSTTYEALGAGQGTWTNN